MTPRYPDLVGRVAVVTGASRGIGAATARLLAANGTAVALVARDKDALDEVRESIWDAGGRAVVAPADCTCPEDLVAAADQIAAELGDVDIVAAFAGGNGMPEPTLGMSLETWRRALDGDLTATYLTIQTFLPTMVAGGRGSVVTMASAAGRLPSRANVGYAVAKAGVVMLTRHLAVELGPYGIRVNAISPSAIRNEKMSAAMTPEQIDGLGRTFPLGRVGEPDDVASAAMFLASEASGWITGMVLDVSGGKVV
jgi:3-oxoacyl-[acyl-carrier protein] reductase